MLLLTRGLNDCCWSFVLRVDPLSIVFVSSLMFACCRPFFWHDNIENVAGLDISQLLLLPAAIQRIFNYNIQILAFFVFPVNLWNFSVNHMTWNYGALNFAIFSRPICILNTVRRHRQHITAANIIHWVIRSTGLKTDDLINADDAKKTFHHSWWPMMKSFQNTGTVFYKGHMPFLTVD